MSINIVVLVKQVPDTESERKLVPGAGWVPCDQSDPDAMPDLNRLHAEAEWDRRGGRFVRRAAGTERT